MTTGLVAELSGGGVGAVWYRLFGSGDAGYGYVAEDVPEFTLAVMPGWRGMGIVTRLLREILRHARQSGFEAISLRVSDTNPAVSLYESLAGRLSRYLGLMVLAD